MEAEAFVTQKSLGERAVRARELQKAGRGRCTRERKPTPGNGIKAWYFNFGQSRAYWKLVVRKELHHLSAKTAPAASEGRRPCKVSGAKEKAYSLLSNSPYKSCKMDSMVQLSHPLTPSLSELQPWTSSEALEPIESGASQASIMKYQMHEGVHDDDLDHYIDVATSSDPSAHPPAHLHTHLHTQPYEPTHLSSSTPRPRTITLDLGQMVELQLRQQQQQQRSQNKKPPHYRHGSRHRKSPVQQPPHHRPASGTPPAASRGATPGVGATAALDLHLQQTVPGQQGTVAGISGKLSASMDVRSRSAKPATATGRCYSHHSGGKAKRSACIKKPQGGVGSATLSHASSVAVATSWGLDLDLPGAELSVPQPLQAAPSWPSIAGTRATATGQQAVAGSVTTTPPLTPAVTKLPALSRSSSFASAFAAAAALPYAMVAAAGVGAPEEVTATSMHDVVAAGTVAATAASNAAAAAAAASATAAGVVPAAAGTVGSVKARRAPPLSYAQVLLLSRAYSAGGGHREAQQGRGQQGHHQPAPPASAEEGEQAATGPATRMDVPPSPVPAAATASPSAPHVGDGAGRSATGSEQQQGLLDVDAGSDVGTVVQALRRAGQQALGWVVGLLTPTPAAAAAAAAIPPAAPSRPGPTDAPPTPQLGGVPGDEVMAAAHHAHVSSDVADGHSARGAGASGGSEGGAEEREAGWVMP